MLSLELYDLQTNDELKHLVSFPIPLLQPVIIAVLFFKSIILNNLLRKKFPWQELV